MLRPIERRSPLVTALVAASLFAGGLAAAARAAESGAPPLQLRAVMQELGSNMQRVTDAISREEWARVAEVAPRIANHPEPPPEEKVRIITFLGAEAGRFRGFDQQTHVAADEMTAAAKRADGAGVIAAFAKVQTSCLGCHEGYRKKFIANFYGSR